MRDHPRRRRASLRRTGARRRARRAAVALLLSVPVVVAGVRVDAAATARIRASAESRAPGVTVPVERTPAAAGGSSETVDSSIVAYDAVPDDEPLPPPVVVSPVLPLARLQALVQASGTRVSVSVRELGGTAPRSWSINGTDVFEAGSTYKLPVLMAEAQELAEGRVRASDLVCYQDSDWEDGWYQDYADGLCLSRQELARRAGQQSDNTAAHMLVRDLGGTGALNAYASAHGSSASAFYDPNTTTADDLSALLADEATGRAGGAAAESWLSPLLTHTSYEAGIPAGLPPNATAVHKVGWIDGTVNDTALVTGGPAGPYVLAVCTDGPAPDGAWSLVAQISSVVWLYESGRAAY